MSYFVNIIERVIKFSGYKDGKL